MAVDFFFDPSSHQIPSLRRLRDYWSNVPNLAVINKIAQEYQYLFFHDFVIKNIRSTRVGSLHNPPYVRELDLSVRAGAIKGALLICASIAEAVLRAHAEQRKYPLNKDEKRRTFGDILNAWKDGGNPHRDIASIWDELQQLKSIRDNIHLFKAAMDPSSSVDMILQQERKLFNDTYNKVLPVLQQLTSP